MKRRSLTVNALINIIKNLVTILVPLITYPYAARKLGVENIGKYSFSNSIISYFVLLAGLGISTYASREGAKYRDDSSLVSRFSKEVFSINFFSCVISYGLLGLSVCLLYGLSDYFDLMIIQSFAILGNLLSINWLYTIFEDYWYITKRTIITNLATLILILLFVRRPNDYYLYALFLVLPNMLMGVVSWFYAGKKYFWILLTFRLNIKRHIKPILILFSVTIATTIYVNSDSTMLGIIYSDYEVGIYSAAAKIYTAVKTLITALIMVLLPRLTNLIAQKMDDTYNILIEKVQTTLFSIVFPATIGLFLLADQVIVLFAGNAYISAALLLKVLCLGIIFALYSTFITNAILLPHDMEQIVSVSTWSGAIINIIANVFLIQWIGTLGAAITTVLSEGIVMIIQIKYSKVYLKNKFNFKDGISIFIGCCAIALVCEVIKSIFSSYIIILCLSIIGSIFSYMLVQYAMGNSFLKYCISKIRK